MRNRLGLIELNTKAWDKSFFVKFFQEGFATLHITAVDTGQISIVQYI